MAKKLILILGGARSGKSDLAQKIAVRNYRDVLFVATAEAGDAEMAARITAHQASRPANWKTLEAPRHVGSSLLELQPAADVILLDCLTLLISNLIAFGENGLGPKEADRVVDSEIDELLRAYRLLGVDWIIVSNEVGLGLVPPYELGRTYRDVLGRANQRLAAAADEVYFMAAGLPLKLK
jgi:adenosylcobinamide kinase / adenosylcobinamide-phosphate guanylyltransferase